MEGLHLLPWVQSHRDELRKKKAPNSSEWMDCRACKEMSSQGVRQTLHCGYLRKGLWREPGFVAPASWPRRGGVCPGYLVRLPAVCEVADAYLWWASGQLDLWLDGDPVSALLKACIGQLKSAISEAESAMIAGGS